jgi:hypothetical protein
LIPLGDSAQISAWEGVYEDHHPPLPETRLINQQRPE